MSNNTEQIAIYTVSMQLASKPLLQKNPCLSKPQHKDGIWNTEVQRMPWAQWSPLTANDPDAMQVDMPGLLAYSLPV